MSLRGSAARSGRRLLLACALCVMATAAAARNHIVVVAQVDNPVHAETLDALRAGLERTGAGRTIDIRAPAAGTGDRLDPDDLVITIGTEAAHIVANGGTRATALHILLPQRELDALPHPPGSGPRTALVLDQPAARQLALLRLALPGHKHIALISSPVSAGQAAAVAHTASAFGLSATTTVIDDEKALYPALSSALDESTILLSLPDSRVYNARTIANVLLTAFRLRAPVLGFSAAYVRAGAMLGLYATPSQVGTEGANLARRLLAGEPAPAPDTHALFEVEINRTVARALGLVLPETEALTRDLRRHERGQP
jgi:putative ABC transport system substrate-binding protein